MSEYGIQLYSVCDIAEEKPEYAVKRVAEMGYSLVETSSFYGLDGKGYAALMHNAGLKISGSHKGFDELENDFAGTVQLLHDLDCTNYIIPWSGWEAEDYGKQAALCNKYQPMLKKEGIDLHFHNHQWEFCVTKGPGGCIPFDFLKRETDVMFEIDMYWAAVGGADPVKVISENAGRIRFVHMKDGLLGDKGGNVRDLGEGEAPVLEVRDLALKLGLTMIVENEDRKPDGLTAAENSLRYLES